MGAKGTYSQALSLHLHDLTFAPEVILHPALVQIKTLEPANSAHHLLHLPGVLAPEVKGYLLHLTLVSAWKEGGPQALGALRAVLPREVFIS